MNARTRPCVHVVNAGTDPSIAELDCDLSTYRLPCNDWFCEFLT
jgi:hypothetical protein